MIRFFSTTALFLVALVVFFPVSVLAHSTYQKEFLKLYTKGDGVDKEFRNLAKKAKCYVCHQGKEDRKNNNPYGEALDVYLDEEDKKDKEKIIAALKTVAEESINPEDESAPTYGQLISEGKLPGGSLEDCKKEPISATEE